MSEEALLRCIEFERAISRLVVEQVSPWRFGFSFSTPHLQYIRDLNFLDTTPGPDTNAVEIAAEAEQVQGDLELPHRKLRVMDETWANELAPDLRDMGWKVDRFVVMAYEGPSSPPPRSHTARMIDPDEYKVVQRASVIESSPTMVTAVVDQIVAITDQMVARSDTRFVGVDDESGLASACEIISDGKTAQIESVITLEASRRKGLAHSLMSAAITRATSTHDFVFLVADNDDWPKDFYTRIGFRAVGTYCDMVIPDVTNSGEDRG